MRHTIRLLGPVQRHHACKVIDSAPEGWVVTIGPETRSQEQNRKMWPMLQDFANSANLNGMAYSPDQWKTILMSAFRTEGVLINGLNNEPVNLSLKTSSMTKAEFSDFIEFMYSEGSIRGVMWSEPSLSTYEEYANG